MTSWDFLVDRDNLHHTRVVPTQPAALADGEVRLSVDAFGFSANNITYAAFGDMIGYWSFFPAPPTDDDVNWGRVPVWGFADVVESTVDEVPVGERVYGYLPMSTELIVQPGRISPGNFTDLSEHRSALPATYNNYSRNAGDVGYDEHFENEQMLLRPLFFTSWLIDDFLVDNDFFGASTVIATSASSKTAFGTAHLLVERPEVTVVGLTSAGNVDFVSGLGCYDAVVTYDDLAAGTAPLVGDDGHAVLIDFAGNRSVVRTVHEQLADRLAHSSVIGGTHWDADRSASAPLPGPEPTFFFAPDRIEKRRGDWGKGAMEERIAEAWLPFIEKVNGWIEVEESDGPDAVADVYLDMLEGTASPAVGKILHPDAL